MSSDLRAGHVLGDEADRPLRELADLDSVVWSLRRACALGRVLEVGCGAGQLVRRLVEIGVDAFGVDSDAAALAEAERRVPGRCIPTTEDRLPFPDGAVDTLVSVNDLDTLSDDRLDTFARESHRVARRHVFLRVGGRALSADSVRRPRESWDLCFLKAGFRRHPALLQVIDYAILDAEPAPFVLLYERIPDAALARYPLVTLAHERELHMDMLREAGRRSDAHLQRYAFASSLVRANDTVLDVACGLGYGLAVVAANGRAAKLTGIDNSVSAIDYASTMYGEVAADVQFLRADAHQLEGVADNSVNLVLSFETLEHLPDPACFLRTVGRVLTPGGRFVASVPNEWIDETGCDPNPHHLHVFDADHLLNLLRSRLLVERLVSQTAGGGMKAAFTRTWSETDPRAPRSRLAEWWVAVAMKDPSEGCDVPYVETVHRVAPGGYRPNSISFADAYANPWIRHALISLGIRTSNRAMLTECLARVMRQAGAGSVDLGATLCVMGYQLLEVDAFAADVRALLARIESWFASAGATPHHFRWRVSLTYLCGRLLLLLGKRTEALSWFQRCASEKASTFSPLLATKAVEAAWLAGSIHAFDGNQGAARLWWTAGVRQASCACASDWREVVGDLSEPLTFGIRELGGVLDQAARCAAGLNALDNLLHAPGKLADLLATEFRLEVEATKPPSVAHRDAAPLDRSAPADGLTGFFACLAASSNFSFTVGQLQSFDLQPALRPYIFSFAAALRNSGQAQSALTLADHMLVTLSPTDDPVRWALTTYLKGSLCRELGHDAVALEAFNALLDGDVVANVRIRGGAYYHSAHVFAARGVVETASERLEQCLALIPDHAAARRALHTLRSQSLSR